MVVPHPLRSVIVQAGIRSPPTWMELGDYPLTLYLPTAVIGEVRILAESGAASYVLGGTWEEGGDREEVAIKVNDTPV